jgi:hypothetical protein
LYEKTVPPGERICVKGAVEGKLEWATAERRTPNTGIKVGRR